MGPRQRNAHPANCRAWLQSQARVSDCRQVKKNRRSPGFLTPAVPFRCGGGGDRRAPGGLPSLREMGGVSGCPRKRLRLRDAARVTRLLTDWRKPLLNTPHVRRATRWNSSPRLLQAAVPGIPVRSGGWAFLFKEVASALTPRRKCNDESRPLFGFSFSLSAAHRLLVGRAQSTLAFRAQDGFCQSGLCPLHRPLVHPPPTYQHVNPPPRKSAWTSFRDGADAMQRPEAVRKACKRHRRR